MDFLVDTIQVNTHGTTVNHRLKSVEWFAKLGGFIPETAKTISDETAAPARPCVKKTERNPPVAEKQILHIDIVRLIKIKTQDGKTAGGKTSS